VKPELNCDNCGYQPLVTWREAFYDVLTHPLSTFCFGLVAGGYLVFDAVIAAVQRVAQ
jgi:hypothetical protein